MADYRQLMGLDRVQNFQNTGPNSMQLQQALMSSLVSDSRTKQMQALYNSVSDYYNNPKRYSDEELYSLQKRAAEYGVNVDIASTDKATFMENLGAGIVGSLDSMLFDLIPDDMYSSRRTDTARTIGNWAGILIPALLVTIGSGGLATPGVIAAIGKTGLRGAKKAAFKVGGRSGVKALRTAEKTSSALLNNFMKVTPGGIVGKYIPRGVKGAGDVLKTFDATADFGETLLKSKIGQAGFRDNAARIIKKAQKQIKRGDIDKATDILKNAGPEYHSHIKSSIDSMVKSGKLKGMPGDILKDATSRFGKADIGVDDLDDIAKSFMNYKKVGKGSRGTVRTIMDGLKDGLSKNKSIDDIVSELKLPKSRGDALKAVWKDPAKRAELLRKIANPTAEAEASIISSLGAVMAPVGLAAFEGSFLGRDTPLDDISDF